MTPQARVASFFQAVYPEFTSYLYLPQQHLLFNPLAFILLELGTAYNREEAAPEGSGAGPGRLVLKLIRNVLTNHVCVYKEGG